VRTHQGILDWDYAIVCLIAIAFFSYLFPFIMNIEVVRYTNNDHSCPSLCLFARVYIRIRHQVILDWDYVMVCVKLKLVDLALGLWVWAGIGWGLNPERQYRCECLETFERHYQTSLYTT
jgi:hypothetical protein